jgi:hypothetical protein
LVLKALKEVNMKLSILIVMMAVAAEANAKGIYRCQFSSDRKAHEPFVMTGHIVETDSGENTYLTLQPPSSADIPFDARVLMTNFEGESYNPMAIHPRGNTVSTVAHGELQGPAQEIQYVDPRGNKYILRCEKE